LKPTPTTLFIALALMLSLGGCAKATEIPEEVFTPPAAVLTALPVVTTAPITPTVRSTTASTLPLVVITKEGTALAPIVFTPIPPTETPSPEPTVNETNFPDALIQILQPGNYSQISSPMKVVASVYPGYGNLVGLQLVGENGHLIHDRLLKMVESETGWVNILEEINFEIPSAGESAVLVITTRDEFDRRITQSVRELFLIQIGKSDIEKMVFVKEPYVLTTPKEKAVVKGGFVHVEGFVHAFNTNPIILELLTESGGVMETLIVKLPRGAADQNYVPFSADIPYDVEIRTPVRLTIRQRSTLVPAYDIALSSRLLELMP